MEETATYNMIEELVRKANRYGKHRGRHYLKDGKRWLDWAGCTFVWDPSVEVWKWGKEEA